MVSGRSCSYIIQILRWIVFSESPMCGVMHDVAESLSRMGCNFQKAPFFYVFQ